MSTHIDIYCERLDGEFWAEPINAITNAGFLIAAAILFFQAKHHNVLNRNILVLIFLIAAIGIGSFLFHTFATRWAMLADIIPILFFQIAFIVIYSRHVMQFTSVQVFRLLMVFILLTIASGSLPRDWLNGSIGYLPALLFLSGLGIYHSRTGKEGGHILLIAAGVFIFSLTFRSIDMMVCTYLSIGVHYMWHILNAIVLYLSTLGIIKNSKPIR